MQYYIELHEKWINSEEGGVRADLSGVNLSKANLSKAELSKADLSDANLSSADLRYANLSYADLSNVDLLNANIDYSDFPLWYGSLVANLDDKQVKQLLYHVLSIVKHSNNVSEMLKQQLLTEDNVRIAKEFHKTKEFGKLQGQRKVSNPLLSTIRVSML